MSGGYTIHTNPCQLGLVGLVSLYAMLPLTPTWIGVYGMLILLNVFSQSFFAGFTQYVQSLGL